MKPQARQDIGRRRLGLARARGHHPLQIGYSFDERRESRAYPREIFIDFREFEIEAVPMPNDVSETLQFDEQSVEFGIEQSRALAVDRRRHLIQQILMCRLAGWNISVDIVGEAQHQLFDAVVDVVDVVDAERQAEPRAHSLME
jgi:hypothetical protein